MKKRYTRNMSSKRPTPKTKIIIIGGGISGLSAGITLTESNFNDFFIVEADKNLGGRIKTVLVDNKPLELGAQWIHGSENSLHDIAKNNCLISDQNSNEGDGIYVRDDGYVFDDDIIKLVDFRVGKILEDCEKFKDTSTCPSSVGNYLEKMFLKYLNNHINNPTDREKYLELFDWHVRFQTIDNSCKDMDLVSAKEWGQYYCPGLNGQEHINLKDGFGSLVELLVKKIDPEKIHTNIFVEKIHWKSNNNKVTVSTISGKTYTCDHVIVTCSIGVLKRDHKKMFLPNLPPNLTSAIDSMGFGSLGKVFLIFKEKWWCVKGFQLIWRKGVEIKGEKSWLRHISGIDTVYNHPNVLVAWVSDKGVKIMESLPRELLGKHCVDLLRQFLRKNDIPYPVDVIRSSWLSDPRIKGGYSYATPDCEGDNKDRSQLLKSVFEGTIPRIIFAGEAVHLTQFSTVHGAFESGKMQTENLLKYLNNCKTS